MLGIGSSSTFQGAFQAAALLDQLVLFLLKLVGSTTQLEVSLLSLSFHVLGPLLLFLKELREKSLLIFQLLPEHVSVDRGGWRRCRTQWSR